MVLVFWVRICWALRTSCDLSVYILSCISSTLNDCFPNVSLAVFQFKFLKPFRAQTICIVFSIIKLGFVIALSSMMDALVNYFTLSFISWVASAISYSPRDSLNCFKIWASAASLLLWFTYMRLLFCWPSTRSIPMWGLVDTAAIFRG